MGKFKVFTMVLIATVALMMVFISGCIPSDQIGGVVSDTQASIVDPNSGLNKAVDTIAAGTAMAQGVIQSPVGVLVPEPWRSIAAAILFLLTAGLAGYQTVKKKAAEQKAAQAQGNVGALVKVNNQIAQEKSLAVNTLGTVVQAIQQIGADVNAKDSTIDALKSQIQDNQIAAGIYPAAKTLISEVKKPMA